MRDRASLDDLAAFAAVANAGGFARAAAGLGMSTSNLSHTIRRLETRLGQRLLQRNSRGVALTEAGERLLCTLGPALESVDNALGELERGRGQVAGRLRLTATRQAYEAVVRPVLPAFTATHPDAVVEVSIDYRYRDIVADRFDAGIRLGEKLAPDVVALKVGPDLRMAVVASPGYIAHHGTPAHPRDLQSHRCINYRLERAGVIYAWEFERDGEELEVAVAGPLIFNDPALMLEAALDGLAVGYVLDHEVEPYLATGQLVQLLPEWTPPFPGFHLYYTSRNQIRPVLAAFIDAIRESRRAG
jgi:DNA-binding transcriptional LysR family regulator